MRFHLDPLSRAFDAVVLVWTEGLKASKCMRFQTETHWCRQGLTCLTEEKVTLLRVKPIKDTLFSPLSPAPE